MHAIVPFPVSMRAIPSLAYSGATFQDVSTGSALGTSVIISSDGNSINSAFISFLISSGTVTAGATNAARILNNTNWSMIFSAEL
jgi:hypothetical protein